MQFFLQLAVILATCKVVGLLAQKIGQPQVVGEMIAGVMLGPSLFGLLLPDWQKSLFPSGPSMGILYAVSQVGLVLFMFLIGLEFNVGLIRNRVRSAVSVSLAGIVAPLLLGSVVALIMVAQPGVFFPDGISPWQAMLILSAAIAITAFPMLSRIILERKLAGTPLGTLALAAGATDDLVSWLLFALLMAVIRQDPTIAVLALVGGALYAAGVLTVGRRLLGRLGAQAERRGGVTAPMLSVVLIVVMLGAWLTDVIGIYAIFGGFLLGVAMPRGVFARHLRSVLEPVVTNFLLPLFFIFSGLNVQLGLVNSWAMWGIVALVLTVSVLGKGVACWGAARLNGVPNREALAIGSLMNARGLMELILLNIGLQAGVITPTLFTIMVLMAVVTTLMASPLFELFYGRFRPASVGPEPSAGLLGATDASAADHSVDGIPRPPVRVGAPR